MTSGRGHQINDRVQSTEVEPRLYVWVPRPNPATVVITLPVRRKNRAATGTNMRIQNEVTRDISVSLSPKVIVSLTKKLLVWIPLAGCVFIV